MIFPITNLESLFKSTLLDSIDLANLSPVSIASYFALLLVVGNWSWTLYFRMSPSDEVIKSLTPSLPFVYDSLVYTIHNSKLLVSSSTVNSAMKSAKTLAFMTV